MLRLILETSSLPGTWVLSRQGQILASGTCPGSITASLVPSLRQNFPQEFKPDQIVVGVGPGSFSSIRSAIAAAEGMAAVWRCPVLPVRSTGAIAWRHAQTTLLGVFSDARRGDFFVTYYSHGVLKQPTAVHPMEKLSEFLAPCTMSVSPDALPGVSACEKPEATSLSAFLHAHGLEPGLLLEPIHLRPALSSPPSA
ncbi:MAG: tRNA (adenosine(37)-N6)-threonylcarbamoyltransferase complex dimerization subunit type 1 TsaB [Verrucomicrobia bacterium]|nr:tRNA (adenosine(37)-N6)-threonylcarbamoyltransferase complex dimerization subunit type 1 TsaB [Verrucomicrobiota bacterium]